MSKIEITNLTFSYEGSYENIFEDVSLSLDTNWKLGLISRNGRGKTTLLQLLAGRYSYQGQIRETVDFTYFPYEVKNKRANTEEVIFSIVPTVELWEIQRELNYMEVDEGVLFRPFETLSNGEQTKVLMVALFLKENAFLLIDEPTNHLDSHGRAVISKYLNRKKGYIVVSHDRGFLDGCINHVLSINKTNIVLERGTFSSWWENKLRQEQFEFSENQRLEHDIKKLKEGAERSSRQSAAIEKKKIGFNPEKREKFIGTRSYLGEKSRKMMARSKNMERRQNQAIDEKSKLLKNIEKAEALKIHPLEYHKNTLISGDKLGFSYGEKELFKNLSFGIEVGDKIGLVGNNGAGKSSFLKMLMGEITPKEGCLAFGSQLKISYIPQDTSYLNGTLEAFIMENAIDPTIFKTNLKKLNFRNEDFEKNLFELSDGQKKKVLLACSLSQEAHLFIWDEPLNYLDIYSITQIENLILSYDMTIIFVEHDITFCSNVTNKLIYL